MRRGASSRGRECDFAAVALAILNEIHDRLKNEISIYPNPVQREFYFRNTNLYQFEASSIKITNLLGEEVAHRSVKKENDIEVQLEPGLPAGSYIIKYTLNGQPYNQKLIKVSE